MAHVVQKQLALDIVIKGCVGHHVDYMRYLSLEPLFVDRQLAVFLDAYRKRFCSASSLK